MDIGHIWKMKNLKVSLKLKCKAVHNWGFECSILRNSIDLSIMDTGQIWKMKNLKGSLKLKLSMIGDFFSKYIMQGHVPRALILEHSSREKK